MLTTPVLSLLLSVSLALGQKSFLGYGRYPCTMLGLHWEPVANKTACVTPEGKSLGQCVLEPVYGNYFCGIAGATCSADVPCDGGACVNGICAGGLGEMMQAPGVCLGALAHGAGGICGAIAAECSGGTGSAVRNDLCVSGVCNPDNVHCIDASMQEGTGCNNGACNTGYYCVAITDTCSKVSTEVGGSCFYGGSAACGHSPTAGPLYCEGTNHTCAPRVQAGANCSVDDQCVEPLYCTSNTRKCAAKVNKVHGRCGIDPYAQCGIDPFLRRVHLSKTGQLYPYLSISGYDGLQNCTCEKGPAPPANTPPLGAWALGEGSSCKADPAFSCGSADDGTKLYCTSQTRVCAKRVTELGGSCNFDPVDGCGISHSEGWGPFGPSHAQRQLAPTIFAEEDCVCL